MSKSDDDSEELIENLTENDILKITSKKFKSDVQKIDAFALGIRIISPLINFPNLTIISLSLNSISTLDAFSTCFSLQELYIRKNKILDLVQIGHLQNLSLLKVLFIADNPCCDDKKYRIKTVQVLKGLRKLDNDVICNDELENIKNVNDPEIVRFQEDVKVFLNKKKCIQFNESETCPSKDDEDYQNKNLQRNESVKNIKNENESGKILRAVKLLLSDLSNDDLDTVRSFCDHILEMRK